MERFETSKHLLTNQKILISICDTNTTDDFNNPYKTSIPIFHKISFIRNAHGAFVLFDISSRASFETGCKWINSLKSLPPYDRVEVILVGCKSDILGTRQVEYGEVRQLFLVWFN